LRLFNYLPGLILTMEVTTSAVKGVTGAGRLAEEDAYNGRDDLPHLCPRGEAMMDVLETIKSRRSVREFLPSEVPWKDLELILDMARYAPNPGNAQPWKFLVVRNAQNKTELKGVVREFLRARSEDQRDDSHVGGEQGA
jgi:hypothetical protein